MGKRRDKLLCDLQNQVEVFADTVVPLYRVLNWRWVHDNTFRVPDTVELRKCCFDLIESLRTNHKAVSITSGGIQVELHGDDESDRLSRATLSFVYSREVYLDE